MLDQRVKTSHQLFMAAILSLLLFGCGSTPKPQAQTPVEVERPVEIVPEATSLGAAELIAEAQQSFSLTGDEEQRNQQLLQAAEQFYAEANCPSALVVLHSIRNWQSAIPDTIHRNLLLAECAPAEQLDAAKRLAQLEILSPRPELRQRQLKVRAAVYASQQQFIQAAAQYVQLQTPTGDENEQIWRWINAAAPAQQQAVISQHPGLRSWLNVAATLRRYGDQPQQIAQFYADFLVQYPEHYLSLNTPVEITRGIAAISERPRNIVVMLPLTGRLSAQGNAIKQGLLSAYFDSIQVAQLKDALPPLQFVDTTTFNFDVATEQVLQADLIIGPLTKTNIERLQPLLSPNTTLLALNRTDSIAANPDRQSASEMNQAAIADESAEAAPEEAQIMQPDAFRFYFALAPEDEAQQLAKYIYTQGYRAPILVHAQDTTSQRLSAAFLAQWREMNQQTDNQGITVVSYDSTDAMREGVGSALDVAQSRARIAQLERLLGPELYNVPRNRRDVDAIVAFASPEQIELLNPIIESSLSPFTDKNVPVYVTSRSIRFDVSKNQLRDLQNVHFFDMPWMMPTHQWTALEEQIEEVFPQQRDPLRRLFALGYDAYQQFQNLPYMASIPQFSVLAMSGKLWVNDNNEVVRELPLAIIDEQQVRLLANP